jgi:ankyrin repeat protein
MVGALLACALPLAAANLAYAQTPPSAEDLKRYAGLHRAAARGDAAEIARLLARGADPNARDPQRPHSTPRRRLWFSRVSTLRALVEAGANVNIADRRGMSPLAHARARGYTEMVFILEKAGGR